MPVIGEHQLLVRATAHAARDDLVRVGDADWWLDQVLGAYGHQRDALGVPAVPNQHVDLFAARVAVGVEREHHQFLFPRYEWTPVGLGRAHYDEASRVAVRGNVRYARARRVAQWQLVRVLERLLANLAREPVGRFERRQQVLGLQLDPPALLQPSRDRVDAVHIEEAVHKLLSDGPACVDDRDDFVDLRHPDALCEVGLDEALRVTDGVGRFARRHTVAHVVRDARVRPFLDERFGLAFGLHLLAH